MNLGTRMVVAPPGVSPWETVLREVELHAHAGGWDQPTGMYWVDWLPGDDGGVPGLGLRRPTLPGRLGSAAPDDLLNAMADLWRWELPDEMVAVALTFEVFINPDGPVARVAMMTRLEPVSPVRVLGRLRGAEPEPVGEVSDVVAAVAVALRRLARVAATAKARGRSTPGGHDG